jgi:protein phosphatase
VRIGQRYGETNTGRKRRRNEDAFVCEPPLFAVADGMGGAQAGEIASSLAAAALSGALAGGQEVPPEDAGPLVVRLIEEANRRVHERATHDAAASGMGTTITVVLVGSNDTVTIGHVGDSRAYRVRDSALEQLTDDHSLVAELVRRGELTPAQAETHPQRSVITRALGTDSEVEIDVDTVDARDGDVYLLCSDGLSTMVGQGEIAEIVERNRNDLQAATHELIDAANRSGGEDNITAVLFELLADDTSLDGAAAIAELATAESAAPEPAPAPDEEDTLHPEDGVPVIAGAALTAGDTVVLAPQELRPTFVDEPAPPEPVPPEHEVPLGRRILALLVIVALAAVVVALAFWGLAR